MRQKIKPGARRANRDNIFYLAILIGFMLSACKPAPYSQATDVPQKSQRPATWTPHPTRTPIPPPTRRPTRTAEAPASPTSTLTPEQFTTLPTLTVNPQTAATETAQAPFQACRYDTYFDAKRRSPQGDWYVCGDGGKFEVVNRNGLAWDFSSETELGIEYYGDFRLIHWTQDQKFLYLAVMNPVDGPGPLTANAEALLRMNLSNGKVTVMLGKIDADASNDDFYAVSISPTSRRLVYSNGYIYRAAPASKKLHIVDLQSGEEKILPIDPEYNQIGNFVWSNDGLKLAFTLYATPEDYCQYSYSIRLLDLTTLDATTFIKNIAIDQCGEVPYEYNVVSILDNSVMLEKNGEIWKYELLTQRLSLQATITPHP
jgi:hypothetical protein